MKKIAITVLIMGVISMGVLQAQSDFGSKTHDLVDPNPLSLENSQKSTQTYSLPFDEEFEGASFPPTDWATFIGTNGAGNNYNWTEYYGYSGIGAFIYWEIDGGHLCEDWLVTPKIQLGENTSLSFYESQLYTTDYDSEYYIKISTTSQNNHSDFVDVLSYGETDFSTSWSLRHIDLSTYDGQEVYIAFVMTNDDGDAWRIDNLSITEDPSAGGVSGGELVISEIAYPYENDGEKGRFVELYNSGDEEIDLSAYYLAFFKNTQKINLTGTIAPGETFIYAPDASDFYSCYGFYPDQEDGGINQSWFNGSDAIYLMEQVGSNFRRRDTYGVKKADGSGSEWDYIGKHAVRNPEVIEYNKNFDVNEWEISTAYYEYRDVTPGNHNDVYYWSGSYNDEWDEYRNWTVNTGFNAIPDVGANVIIPSGTTNEAELGLYEFPYYFNSITIRSGASFTLESFNELKIKNEVIIENGATLSLKSDENGAASFIPEGNVSGEVDIQRWVPTIGGTPSNGEWHYFTPPITDFSSSVFNDQYLMYWEEPNTSWFYIYDNNLNLTPGVGYGVLLNNTYGNTIDFSGELATGDITSPVLHNTNGSGWQGWNLIGNPYTASLDWEQVVSELPAGIDVGVHYWDAENDQYVFYNNGNGSAPQYIPPMQGFFIHTNTDNVQFTIPASARTHEGKEVFYKSGEGKPSVPKYNTERIHQNRLIVSSISPYGNSDKTFIEFHDKASVDFDFEFDAEKFSSNNEKLAEIYLLFEGKKFAINALPPELLEGRYDLCVNFGLNESYTLLFDDVESFDETQPVLLYDKFTGEYFDLRENYSINFYNDNDAPENRFEIVFDNFLNISEISTSNWLVYAYNGKLNIRKNINAFSDESYTYQVISLDGKIIEEQTFTNEINNKALKVASDIYLIKIIENNDITTHKVLLYQ